MLVPAGVSFGRPQMLSFTGGVGVVKWLSDAGNGNLSTTMTVSITLAGSPIHLMP